MRRRTISKSRCLTIATCQFPVSADIRANGAFIRRQMRLAARRGAEIVHFSETALSGYAGAQFTTFDGFPWGVLEDETRRVRDLAVELGVWTILGSTHRQPRGKPLNCLYLIAPTGRIVKRYDKCFLMRRDRRYYAPGRRLVTHSVGGVKFGLLICFDFRFPEIWREHLKRRCRLVFASSYLASPKRNRVMEAVAPATMATRASENFFHLAANNTTGEKPWCTSRVHRPDGSVACQAPSGRPAVLTCTIDLAADAMLYNPIGPLALRVALGEHPWETV
ncbi:MAG TPA: carbon-nitrogen hydrolase family protein [Planctomycetota bacterium]|nr:carbon-nitrogen hydrolase family protein [Planctomycetota bacterium]